MLLLLLVKQTKRNIGHKFLFKKMLSHKNRREFIKDICRKCGDGKFKDRFKLSIRPNATKQKVLDFMQS